MVRHTSIIVAVPSKADTQLSPMGVAWSTNALVACSLRMGSQDSPRSHGPIVLRCPGSGRFPPMSTPLISVSFPNLFGCSRSRPIECEFCKVLSRARPPPQKGWDTLHKLAAPFVWGLKALLPTTSKSNPERQTTPLIRRSCDCDCGPRAAAAAAASASSERAAPQSQRRDMYRDLPTKMVQCY